MNWQLPGKTFLLGEYAALMGGAAMILTTTPCFQLSLSSDSVVDPAIALASYTCGSDKIPLPQTSPAWRWWLSQSACGLKLDWQDPYRGKGGCGASSAEFIAVYLAHCHLQGIKPELKALLQTYQDMHEKEERGLKPSGYDLIAQSLHLCVYVSREKKKVTCYDWVFADLDFLLIHSGKKLATHSHLSSLTRPIETRTLSALAEKGHEAFAFAEPKLLIASVNAYQEALEALNLTCQHSLERIKQFQKQKKILAVKGCGALGADVFLLLFARGDRDIIANSCLAPGESLLASSDSLYRNRNPYFSASLL